MPHAGQHRDHEHQRLRLSHADCHQGRTRTEARDAPADAEHDAANDEAPIDRLQAGQPHGRAEQRPRAPPSHCKRNRSDSDRTGHHESKRRVPSPTKVQEAQHLGGIGHAGNDQAQAEHQAREK
ncbi:hypothetical protein J2X92_004225 [Variovorax paradoxus]|nr:hypothetical protein [Variovorax paradoxus]